MYARDPRLDWTPMWADELGVQPWQCDDLTPAEHDAIVAYVTAKSQNPKPSLF